MPSLQKYLYYQSENITLYCGDCHQILPLLDLSDVSLLLTDPPYGINLDTAFHHRQRGCLAKARNYPRVTGDNKKFDPSFLLNLKIDCKVIWGANYYSDKLPNSSGWLVWDKRCGMTSNDQSDCELAWTNYIKGVRIFHHQWSGCMRDSERGTGYHPTQKPAALMNWVLSLLWTPKVGTVLDPYMGGGPVAVACQNTKRPYIGMDIEEQYCKIAVERLKMKDVL